MEIFILTIATILIFAIAAIFYQRYRKRKVPEGNLESAIHAEVRKLVKDQAYAGLVVGVYKNGKTFIKGFGIVSEEIKHPPDAETVFQIGSISKVLTASLLQRLCEEGVVSMDDTLEKLLGPSMPLAPSVKGVTLRQLVTHTSGFPRIPKVISEKMAASAGGDDPMLDPYRHLTTEDIFGYLASAEDKQNAGRFDYSNYGMGLLGHILEVVTGEEYESMVTEKILHPLNMNHTVIALTPEMKAKLAQGYTGKGVPTPIWSFGALQGAGAFSSTAEDLIKFIQASVAEEGLASELLRKMAKPQFSGKTGIGWIQPTFIDRIFGGGAVVWHDGMVGGYASYLAIDKDRRTGVIVLANQASHLEMLGMMLMRQARMRAFSSNNLHSNT